MIIANPLLNLSEFRKKGFSRYRHGGQVVPLGIGKSLVLGWGSPVEFNFSETANGRSTRGSISLNRFYVAKQNVIDEKVWHWTPTRGQSGNWKLEDSSMNLPDDPDPALVSFNAHPAEISFYDSPGFLVQYFSAWHQLC